MLYGCYSSHVDLQGEVVSCVMVLELKTGKGIAVGCTCGYLEGGNEIKSDNVQLSRFLPFLPDFSPQS